MRAPLALDVGHEADTAGVVLVGGVVQAVLRQIGNLGRGGGCGFHARGVVGHGALLRNSGDGNLLQRSKGLKQN
jgi:hypothetical protein